MLFVLFDIWNEQAIEMGVMIILDNWHDVHNIGALLSGRADTGAVRVMIRFTPGIECHTHEYIRTGHTDSKFGFSREDVERVLIELKSMSGVVLQGLHCHIGSQIFELQPHADLASVRIRLTEHVLYMILV
jgi:diaminopimelate decarboxylase